VQHDPNDGDYPEVETRLPWGRCFGGRVVGVHAACSQKMMQNKSGHVTGACGHSGLSDPPRGSGEPRGASIATVKVQLGSDGLLPLERNRRTCGVPSRNAGCQSHRPRGTGVDARFGANRPATIAANGGSDADNLSAVDEREVIWEYDPRGHASAFRPLCLGAR
jgi:hypothetical protein